MNIQSIGAVASRAAGVVLLIIGASSFLSWPWPIPVGTDLHLHDTYYVVSHVSVSSLAQCVAGLVMILFSRPVGRWLAGSADRMA